MNPQILEALCTDFTAIYQCDLIQDTIDIVRFDKGTHTDMAIQTMDPYTLHSWYIVIDPSNWSTTIYFSFLSTFNNRG
jgi:hypothetical protein